MTSLLALFLAFSTPAAPRPTPFASGTDLTVELGWQGGGSHTVDGVRLGIGMLTQRTGGNRWMYELSFVSGRDYCRRWDDRRYCDYRQWALQGFGGIQKDIPLTGDSKLFASLTGGFFAGIASWENWYRDHDGRFHDDMALMGGVLGKAALLYDFDAFRLGLGVFAAFGPALGTESGLGIYFPAGMHFIFHFKF